MNDDMIKTLSTKALDIVSNKRMKNGQLERTWDADEYDRVFAKLVMEYEREQCAMVCEYLPAPDIYNDTDKSMWDVTSMDCAEAIRNRGNNDR
jgi:hypothetical protein